jgi:ABC-type multidrug transport system fused ATPase/permease subunit
MKGSVRQNLDPFDTASPDLLRLALQRAALASTDAEAEAILGRTVDAGGSNFSCGERQLLCLARAVISNPQVLVMDEPTSSTDPVTDGKLQSMMRTEFDCTALCIAHRIQTIADSDLVLVMQDGSVQEFGPPEELLLNKEGEYHKLCTMSGVAIPMQTCGTVMLEPQACERLRSAGEFPENSYSVIAI